MNKRYWLQVNDKLGLSAGNPLRRVVMKEIEKDEFITAGT